MPSRGRIDLGQKVEAGRGTRYRRFQCHALSRRTIVQSWLGFVTIVTPVGRRRCSVVAGYRNHGGLVVVDDADEVIK